MNEDDCIWDEYCRFYERDFQEQLEYNRKRKEEHFKKWKETKTAKYICDGNINDFEKVPITTYDDYPILKKFSRFMERKTEKLDKSEDELWWDYYSRFEEEAQELFDGWLPYDYSIPVKTTGTLGKSKWVGHGEKFYKNFQKEMYAIVGLACTDKWGDTKLEYDDVLLNALAPIPYLGGYCTHVLDDDFELLPPLSVSDNISDMRQKILYMLKQVKKGKEFDVAGALASTLHLMINYIVYPEKFYRYYYESSNLGLKKVGLYLLYLKSKLFQNNKEEAKETLSVKGLSNAGLGTKTYGEKINQEFGVYPLSNYASTELGPNLLSMPNDRKKMMPMMRIGYYEFLDEDGNLNKIDELKKGESYELVGTPFGSIFVRYNIEDLIKVVDFRDDGMPLFEVEGRKASIISINNYFRLTESLVYKILNKAGFKNSDRCAVTKRLEEEKLIFLMEEEWNYSEEEAEERLFKAMSELIPDFRSYIRDFGIKDADDVIEVEYLNKGAFMRYTLQKIDEGVPMGQYKPKKIIPEESDDDIEFLRKV